MLKGLRALADSTLLLLRLHREIRALRLAGERIATALEFANAHHWPAVPRRPDGLPAVEVTYVDDAEQATFMDIELRLTAATGQPPTEEEVLQEWQRRVDQQGVQPDA